MRTRIRDVRVFDGERTLPETDVLIDGDRIAEPGAGPVDVEVDGTGRTLLPGLIDAHTHAFDGDLAEALKFGVTTELDMNNLPPILAAQRRQAAERDDVADLRSSSMIATAPHGHPTQIMTPDLLRSLGADGGLDTVADSGEAKAFVEARLDEGADYLKIAIDDGAVSGMKLPALTPDLAAVLVEAGHAAGLRVIAHTVTAREALLALDAGVDGLAHLYSDVPEERAEEVAARIAAYDAFVVSTITYIEAVTTALAKGIPMHAQGVRNASHAAAALHRAGVPLLAGTDATPFGPAHGAALHRELLLLTRAGLTPEQALRSATSATARCFGLADRGVVAPGRRADLLLIEGDPTTDITATRSIAGVWRAGTRL
ncbi:Imidazolonepropionase [Nonomuraea solani]|uniref:Imidazolonepropionase n=1 Tax=Nonomuraea solani TaxID=1144553 RepID=A0A1H5UWH0_9ACTN|nr:amidohydrolase family protein [Nonomuraea solani]SEF79304.1 Imidazolonepropionase [Nonomuraea solani]